MRLRSKIFLSLAFLSALFFLFLHSYWFPQSLRNLEQQELRATAHHLSSVAEGLVPLLLAHQLDTVYENLDSLQQQNKEWVAIRLINRDGKVLYPMQEPVPVPSTAGSKTLHIVERKIQFLGNDLGTLLLTINLQSTISVAETRHRQLVTAFLIVLCGYLFSIGFIVERVVRRPVDRLAHAAEKMALGDFTIPLVTAGKDEVGTLTHSFIRMRDAIRDYQETLLLRNQAITRLSQAVEQSPVSIMITDLEGRLTFVNPKFSQITGYTSEEVLGENPRLLKSGIATAEAYATLWRTISSGGIWYGELCNKRKNGELYWESASISPILDENGAITSYLAVKEDITKRKQAEEALCQLNNELEQRIALEVDKNRTKDHILAHQARLAAMGEMLSNIAHQWRQPLNNVALIIQNLQAEYIDRDLTPDACNEYVEKCINTLLYMSHTIDNFCDFYQPDFGRQAFDLYTAVTESLAMVKEDLEAHGIKVALQRECDLVINGYKKEFSQVLLNIIQNAKEAILLHHPALPFVEIICSQHAESALVTVRDNAGGIPPDILDKIFDPYFTSKFKSQGVGMGLYISKMIIEKHMGGQIWVSNHAAGAEVNIAVPLAATAEKRATVPT